MESLHGCVQLDLSAMARRAPRAGVASEWLNWTIPHPDPRPLVQGKARWPLSRVCRFSSACYMPRSASVHVYAKDGMRGIVDGGTILAGYRWRQEVVVRMARGSMEERPMHRMRTEDAILFHHSWTSYFHVLESAMGVFAAAHLLSTSLAQTQIYLSSQRDPVPLARLFSGIFAQPVQSVAASHSQPVCHSRLAVGYPAQVLHSAWSTSLNAMPTYFTHRFRQHVYAAHAVPLKGEPSGAVIIHRAKSRGITNEAEIIQAFGALQPPVHAVSVDLASMPTRAQVALMSRSKFLLGVHGAGMANAVFLHRKGTAILIKQHHYYAAYLESLLLSLEVNWECWQAPSGQLQWTVMHPSKCRKNWEYDCIRDQDTKVDVSQLPAMVERARQGPAARPCTQTKIPRKEVACFKLCFPNGPPRDLLPDS
ncbi:hypothetical protein AB1Y20_015694 [Prymnesium parvum]|uniref:Glycosyltransferase 61 catalytic domain-containing protein n=1 Tax=Prymnesium parvum TaxID=97485 RepID=A0AB34K1R1_PRYPA